jgi:hypothetical protein
MRPWFENVSKRDAIALCSWWNAHHRDRFVMRPTRRNVRGRRYDVIRQLP